MVNEVLSEDAGGEKFVEEKFLAKINMQKVRGNRGECIAEDPQPRLKRERFGGRNRSKKSVKKKNRKICVRAVF